VEDVKQAIVARRLERIATEGFTFGHDVPAQRQVPLVPFDRAPFVICEVKRRSPSKGVIAEGLDAVGQARLYVESGVKTISVLTEEDHFGGSLADLMTVKQAFPDTAFLRKDFLVRTEDLDVSWRAGADAVLLIASLLSAEELTRLKAYAEALGLEVFVEVHDENDVAKVRPLRPAYTGINCRDLTDFSIDRAIPLMVRPFIDWPTRLVFESGLFRSEEAEWVALAGFQGVLVGEGAVKDPTLARRLTASFAPEVTHHPDPNPSFWAQLYAHRSKRPAGFRPLVKICGLAHYDDVALADELGADLVGFIFAPSKRQVDPAFVRHAPPTKAFRVGVVQLGPGQTVPEEVAALVDDGFLDAIQFHGTEDLALVDAWADRGYKAVGVTGPESWQPWQAAVAPRLLADVGTGGSGQPVPEATLTALASSPFGARRLWLAGGLGPDNVADKVARWKPELVDASSGLEESPGHKDPAKLRRFFREIERVCP
jgi:indole-3-glycerol phosphate synthase/phosphoribosylanthranilate isomerase